ncbi:MAG: pyridoxal-phosphate dependent enzyme [Microbacterium sp.]|nr:MAG: pyridoxal-phosphate dependent enzyme [Microbacterium sp.]
MTDAHDVRCRDCGTSRDSASAFRCARCGGELTTVYAGAPVSAAGESGMWRWPSVLPVDPAGPRITLGEGDTPLVALASPPGAPVVSVKCEHLNPTGSFKDRVLAVAATLVVQRGLRGFVGTSSGNGGASAAAYARRGGFSTLLFTLSDVVAQKLLQIRALGGRAFMLQGIGHDAATTRAAAERIADVAAEHGFAPVLTGGRYAPEAMDGATTIAYEIWEQDPGTTHVYVPVGGGGLLSAIGRGFERLGAAGHTVPRVVAVQPAGCPTLRASEAGDYSGISGETTTAISGLQVAVLFDGPGAWQAIRSSGGHVVEVTDAAVGEAQRRLAEQGLLVEPAGATAYAGALADIAAGVHDAGARVVVVATGAGYKDEAALHRLADEAPPPERITIDALDGVLAAYQEGI